MIKKMLFMAAIVCVIFLAGSAGIYVALKDARLTPLGVGEYEGSSFSGLEMLPVESGVEKNRWVVALIALSRAREKRYSVLGHAEFSDDDRLSLTITRAATLRSEREGLYAALKEFYYLAVLLSGHGFEFSAYHPVSGDRLLDMSVWDLLRYHQETRSILSIRNNWQLLKLLVAGYDYGGFSRGKSGRHKLAESALVRIANATDALSLTPSIKEALPGIIQMGSRPDMLLDESLDYVNNFSVRHFGFEPYDRDTIRAHSVTTYSVKMSGLASRYYGHLLDQGDPKGYMQYLESLTRMSYAWIADQTENKQPVELSFLALDGKIYFKSTFRSADN